MKILQCRCWHRGPELLPLDAPGLRSRLRSTKMRQASHRQPRPNRSNRQKPNHTPTSGGKVKILPIPKIPRESNLDFCNLSRYGHDKTAALLIKHGADVTQVNSVGHTPFTLAITHAKKYEILRSCQVWPLTQFFLFPFCENSLICLEGKSMTPHRGNTILFCSSQQLPRLRLGPSPRLVRYFRNDRDTRTPSGVLR